jgi:hypothetical protein
MNHSAFSVQPRFAREDNALSPEEKMNVGYFPLNANALARPMRRPVLEKIL